MKSQISNRILLSALLCCISFTAVAKQLILETEPEPTVIELIGTVSLDALTGNLRATPEDPAVCSGDGSGDGGTGCNCDCEGVQVDVTSFTANNQGTTLTVNQGTDVRFRWQSRGAWACEGSGFPGWNGTGKAPSNASGQLVSTTDVAPGTYNPELVCDNGANDSSSLTVIIEDGPPSGGETASCEDRGPPAGWNLQIECVYNSSSDCRQFANLWGAWPGSPGITRNFYVNSSNNGRRYVAMRFDSGNLSPSKKGAIQLNVPQFGVGIDAGPILFSISECPGDFHKSQLDDAMGPGCRQHNTVDNWGFNTEFRWGGTDYTSTLGRCGLEPNKTYYLNILYANPTPNTTHPDQLTPFCTDGLCGHNMQPFH